MIPCVDLKDVGEDVGRPSVSSLEEGEVVVLGQPVAVSLREVDGEAPDATGTVHWGQLR